MTDLPKCFSIEVRKAIKHHRCVECPAPIVPGEMYEYASGVWEDGPNDFKTCAPCAEVREQLWEDIMEAYPWPEPLIFGHLQEELGYW